MKNSFFLVIPPQHKDPARAKAFGGEALQQWINELPTANPGLATRLLHDLIDEFIALEIDATARLDALEMLRPSYLIIEDYLRARLIQSAFPKNDNELKIFNVLISLEKQFTIGYWIAAREVTKRAVSWFQGKTIALALQRVMHGLAQIIVSHYQLNLPVPGWIWIDLHSLYQLSVKLKRDATKVNDETTVAGSVAPGDVYRQILLLSLANPHGLMQKEVRQVYRFAEKICALLRFDPHPIKEQIRQCAIPTDEDKPPFWLEPSEETGDGELLYCDLTKLLKTLRQKEKYASDSEARFSSMHLLKSVGDKLPIELFDYLVQRWEGQKLQGAPYFTDRLSRYFAIGLNAAYDFQSALQSSQMDLEYLAETASERALSCQFERHGVLSIGSLISFRKADQPEHKRTLGMVCKIAMNKPDGKVEFEINVLTPQFFAVEYGPVQPDKDSVTQKALIYGIKDQEGEKSLLILESFMVKNGDMLRLYMNGEDFPIIVNDRKNVGLGYWQFECRRIAELPKSTTPETKKGYDFI